MALTLETSHQRLTGWFTRLVHDKKAAFTSAANVRSITMASNEFFYRDKDGKKQDVALHEEILAGDHPVTRTSVRSRLAKPA